VGVAFFCGVLHFACRRWPSTPRQKHCHSQSPISCDYFPACHVCRFHDVVPQEGLPLLAPSQLSQLVVNRAKRTGKGLQLGAIQCAVHACSRCSCSCLCAD
jgi:hypothetical protein